MTCPFCNSSRPVNNAPCPSCGAPAPQAGEPGAWGAGGTGGGYGASPSASWGGPVSLETDNWRTQAPPRPSQVVNDNSLWGQVMAPSMGSGPLGPTGFSDNQGAPGSRAMGMNMPPNAPPFREGQQEAPGQQGQALLPVPYQGNQAAQALMLLTQGTPTINIDGTGHQKGAMLPALPDQEAPVFVPPMYTKPRPIIPRYRAISGLLSVLIVFALLCVGAGYYAKVTGKLTFLHALYGGTRPPNITSATARLPVPPTTVQDGPARNIITSATTTEKVDPQTGLAINSTNQFTVGQAFILTYSVHTTKAGNVTVKWYTNGNLFLTKQYTVPGGSNTGFTSMQYVQPAEGKVELYWNNQLAKTLLFVVEPA